MDESALRKLLASLDATQSSFHWWLEFWTAMVAVGVVLEVIFVIWEYVEDLHDFRRGVVHPPERPSTLLLLLGLFGATLVAVGVSGEWYEETNVEHVETQIRQANDALFLLLSKEAGDAKDSAEAAHALGSDLLGKYTAAEKEIIELKAARLRRRLSSAQETMLRKGTAAFKVKTIRLSCAVGSPDDNNEALDFQNDFVDTFRSDKSPIHLDSYMASCALIMAPGMSIPPMQIEYGAQRKNDADVLVRALKNIGVKKRDIVTTPNKDELLLNLTVGPRRADL